MTTQQAIPVFFLPDLTISFYVGDKLNLKCHIVTPFGPGDYDLGVEIESLDVLDELSDHWQATVLRTLRKLLTGKQAGAWLGADQTPDAIGALMQRYCMGGLFDAGRMAFNTMRAFQPFSVPSFDLFLHAFEHYAGIPIKGCAVMIHPNLWNITVQTPQGEIFGITTVASLKTQLGNLLDGSSANLTDLPLVTSIELWQQVGQDDYMKTTFLPTLLHHWREYWNKEIAANRADVYTKQESWTDLSTFMHCYDSTDDHVGLSAELDATGQNVLLALVIQTLTTIFEFDACLEEYAQLEMASDWQDKPKFDELILSRTGELVPEDESEQHIDLEHFYCRRLT